MADKKVVKKKYEVLVNLTGDINAKPGRVISLDANQGAKWAAKKWVREWTPKPKVDPDGDDDTDDENEEGIDELINVGKDLAIKLKKAGIHTIEQLRARSVEDLIKIPGIREVRAQNILNEVADK